MKSKKETFAGLFDSLAYRYDLRPVFDDFLTMAICAFSQNPVTGKSYDEDLYMETVAKYPKELVRETFPHMLALLTIEMEERVGSSLGNDVLGDFYELHFCRKGTGQFFTPWTVCGFMAMCLSGDAKEQEEPLRIIDPCCGSGRNLLAGAKHLGRQHRYFGIDIDQTCVKMTALNLFLNGVFHGEVMWADALDPCDFRTSYSLSFLPFGIFRIAEKERSWLWHANMASFRSTPVADEPKQKMPMPEIILPSQNGQTNGVASQLKLF